MKKFGILVLMLGALGSAVVGCEPAKKKEAPKAEPAAVEPAAPPRPKLRPPRPRRPKRPPSSLRPPKSRDHTGHAGLLTFLMPSRRGMT